MHRAAYFALGEEVIVDSKKCPDMNGPSIITNRMFIVGRKGSKDGWVYQMLNGGGGRWLMESSLRKDCRPCGETFQQLMTTFMNYAAACDLPLSLKAQEIMDDIMRRRPSKG
jgi:hypothetical protein